MDVDLSASSEFQTSRFLMMDLKTSLNLETTRPVDSSQKVCYVGMAPSSTNVYADNRSAPVNLVLAWLTKGLLLL